MRLKRAKRVESGKRDENGCWRFAPARLPAVDSILTITFYVKQKRPRE